MKYFAAFLSMRDPEKSQNLRAQHLEYLARREGEGKIFARGRFVDGAGGLVIYQAKTLEEARQIAGADPYVTSGARELDLHEWEMTTGRTSAPCCPFASRGPGSWRQRPVR